MIWALTNQNDLSFNCMHINLIEKTFHCIQKKLKCGRCIFKFISLIQILVRVYQKLMQLLLHVTGGWRWFQWSSLGWSYTKLFWWRRWTAYDTNQKLSARGKLLECTKQFQNGSRWLLVLLHRIKIILHCI